jgi:hypothetical protein
MIDFKLSGDVSPKNMPIIELTTALSEFSYIIIIPHQIQTTFHQTLFHKRVVYNGK